MAINYARLRLQLAAEIAKDPATVTFYNESTSWEATGKLAPAPLAVGRLWQSPGLGGSQLVGKQSWVIELPYDTTEPDAGNEARTVRQGVTQRFTVVSAQASPWKLEVVLDESG